MKNFIKTHIRKYLIESQNNNSGVFYHGTGEKQKVIEALKNNTFKFNKTGGVENGIWLTPNKSLAIEYSKIASGADKGVVEIIFVREPKIKRYKNNAEAYADEMSYHFLTKESILKYIEDMLKQGYDGTSSNDDTLLIFKEKINIIKPLDN